MTDSMGGGAGSLRGLGGAGTDGLDAGPVGGTLAPGRGIGCWGEASGSQGSPGMALDQDVGPPPPKPGGVGLVQPGRSR